MKVKSFKFLIPVILILISIGWIIAGVNKYGFYSAAGPGSGFYPCICAALLLIVSVLVLPSTLKEEKSDTKWYQFMPVLGVAGVAAVAELAGIYAAIISFLFLWLFVYEKYSWKFSLLVSVCVAFFIWGVFDYWMDVNFPVGIIAKMFLE